MGHSKGVRSDVWPLHDRKKRREGRDGHRWVTEKEQGMMYGHFTTERKEENETGMRERRDGHRWGVKVKVVKVMMAEVKKGKVEVKAHFNVRENEKERLRKQRTRLRKMP